ncbi:MAG: hypothetical protein H5T91_10340, partial [Synergistetes bacterium]|nr:hypothetical protein [Synergistota bacterium]
MFSDKASFRLRLLAIMLFILLLTPSIALAFKEVKFAVISDPHLSLPAANTKNHIKMEDFSFNLLKEAIDK